MGEFTIPMLEFIKLASVKLTLTPTLKWYTHLLMVDTQLSTLLPMVMFIRLEYTELLSQQCQLIPMESSLPSQALTILDMLVIVSSSVMLKLKLIPNGYTTVLILHTPDTLDTLASTDTPHHTTTMSGTEPNINTCINHGKMERPA